MSLGFFIYTSKGDEHYLEVTVKHLARELFVDKPISQGYNKLRCLKKKLHSLGKIVVTTNSNCHTHNHITQVSVTQTLLQIPPATIQAFVDNLHTNPSVRYTHPEAVLNSMSNRGKNNSKTVTKMAHKTDACLVNVITVISFSTNLP